MNNNLLKLLCSFSIVLTASFPARAGSDPDSARLLAANTTTGSLTTAFIREANIIYPAILQNDVDESLDYVKKYSNQKRDYLIHTYQRGKNIFPKVVSVLKKYELPQELKVLIAMESGFDPNAVSRAGAVGYWQMMDEMARDYGLQTGGKNNDDRKNFVKSTLAAARYLRDRCRNFNNDILLAVASYNCGIGNVRSAIKKAGKSTPGFWDIKKYLPAETRAYVMNFIALNVVFANYDKFINNKMVFITETKEVPVSVPLKLNTAVTD